MRNLMYSVAVLAVLSVCRVDAAQITLMSSNGVREAVSELIPQFEKATGHRVQVIWDGSLNIKKRLNSGEVADLVALPAADVDDLIASGTLTPGSRVDLAKSIIGVAVRAGLPKPDISTSETLTRALLDAKSVVISSGPSGVYLLELFEKQGILGTLRPRLKQLPSGQPVGEVLARGEGDLGFQQVSELLHVSGITYVGPLPSSIQKVTIFAGGIPKTAKDPAIAREFLTFLNSPRNVAVWKKAGLELAAATMLQNLLKERFQLSLHRESVESSSYALVIARGGPKLKASAGPPGESERNATVKGPVSLQIQP